MKTEVDMEKIHQQETPIQYNRPITTTAESYQTTKLEDLHRRPSQQVDSSHSASPAVTTPPRSITSNAPEVGRALVLPDDRNNLANSGEFKHFIDYSLIYFLSLHFTHNY